LTAPWNPGHLASRGSSCRDAGSVVKSRWLCYFQESRSTCRKFYFLQSRSSV